LEMNRGMLVGADQVDQLWDRCREGSWLEKEPTGGSGDGPSNVQAPPGQAEDDALSKRGGRS